MSSTTISPAAAAGHAPAAAMRGITRRFGSVVALDDVDLDLRAGEIHALLGENGAGKTTLMRILAGLDRPDRGTVDVGGRSVARFDPRALREAGVALVQQHFTLVPTLTAGENLVLARPEGWRRPGARVMAARVEALVERYGLAVRTDVPAAQLSVGEQQRLELLRALDANARVMVFDEPTAVLADAEADRLLAVCRSLAAEGRAIVVITHRLGEVFAACDRVTVLRAGRVALADASVAGQTRAGLASAMVGAETAGSHERRRVAPVVDPAGARPRLSVHAVTLGRLGPVEFDVRPGEILGIAGVDGNGQAELEAVLAGRSRPATGTVELDGAPHTALDPRGRIDAGIAYIPSDRYRYGLARGLSLADSLELGRSRRWRRPQRVRHRDASAPIARWDVRTAGPAARTASLSGGNAQKLVLARELATTPRVVVACYPTRGLDPAAADTIATRVVEAAEAGSAVVWFGAELDELFAVADRVLVAVEGRLAGPFLPPFDRAAIGLAMAGGA